MTEEHAKTTSNHTDTDTETTEANTEHVNGDASEAQAAETNGQPEANEALEGEVTETDAAPDDRLAKAEAEANEYKDQWLRSVAEFKNYKRRTEAERAELIRSASAGLIMKLLPVLDDFERAVDSVPEDVAANQWWAGMQLIDQKLRTILESEGVAHIAALGEDFDPNFHEAVLYEEAEGQENKVVEELQKGYKLRDRVLRPTMVKVGKG